MTDTQPNAGNLTFSEAYEEARAIALQLIGALQGIGVGFREEECRMDALRLAAQYHRLLTDVDDRLTGGRS